MTTHSACKRPAEKRVAVNFAALYTFAGSPARRTRVHEIGETTVRISTTELLMLGRSIRLHVEVAHGKIAPIAGRVQLLAGQNGHFCNYEIAVDAHALRQNLGALEVHRGEDRRPSSRVTTAIPVQYRLDDGSAHDASIVDISTSGWRLQTDIDLPVHASIALDAPAAADGRPRRVHLSGHVVRAAGRVGDRYEFGVKAATDADTKATLRSIVLAAMNTTRKAA